MNDKTNTSPEAPPAAPPVIVAISGASGAVYGMEILRALREMNVPSHAIITEAGKLTLKHEMGLGQDSVRELADEVNNIKDVGAKPASG